MVDDSEVNLGLMCEIVRRLGHRPSMASNGQEAIDAAAAKKLDVILMDVSMPVMRGDEANRRIRQTGLSRKAFIAAVTAVRDPQRTVELHDAGMEAVLVKPTNRADVAELLAIVVGTARSAAEQEATASSASSHYAGVLASLEAMLGWHKAHGLMTAALADVPPEVRQDEPLCDISEGMADQLHKAAGSIAVVGLSDLSSHLLKAERSAEAGDLATLNEERRKIAAEVRNCRNALALV